MVKWASGGGSTYDYILSAPTTSATPGACLTTNVATTTQYSFTNLTPNTKYYVRICSRNVNFNASAGIIASGNTMSPMAVKVPFYDEFNRGALPLANWGWEGQTTNFAISGNRLTCIQAGTSTMLLRNAAPGNIRQEISFTIGNRKNTTVAQGAGLLVRYNATTKAGYLGRIRKEKAKYLLEIVKLSGSTQTVLASSKKVNKDEGLLTFTANGSQLSLLFDGKDPITVNDSSFVSGRIGIACYGEGQSMDRYAAR